jgi:hypothetical protein
MLILIGGHPKGFEEPFHSKTKSGRILRKMIGEPKEGLFVFFDLWKNQEQQDLGIVDKKIIKELKIFLKKNNKLIALGRFTEKALFENKIECIYLPHPASRRQKDVLKLSDSLKSMLLNKNKNQSTLKF